MTGAVPGRYGALSIPPSRQEQVMDVHGRMLAAALRAESRRRSPWRQLVARFLAAVGVLV